MYDYCLANGYIKDNICVLCADGIMISKDLYKPELLNELSEYILKTTGFNLKYINKKMNEDYLNILDLHQIININIWDFIFIIYTPTGTSYLKAKTNNKTEIHELFSKLVSTDIIEDILDIQLYGKQHYEVYFPYFTENIYVIIKKQNDNNYYDIVDIINKKRKLNIYHNSEYSIYVLIIDHPINNSFELDILCKENQIKPIYLLY